jgi:hypothetical protein
MISTFALGGIPNKVQVGDMGVDDRAGNPRRAHREKAGVGVNRDSTFKLFFVGWGIKSAMSSAVSES